MGIDSFSILNNILDDLNVHKRNKELLLKHYINKRLNDSLENYYKELLYSFNYLKRKNSFNVSKKINRG